MAASDRHGRSGRILLARRRRVRPTSLGSPTPPRARSPPSFSRSNNPSSSLSARLGTYLDLRLAPVSANWGRTSFCGYGAEECGPGRRWLYMPALAALRWNLSAVGSISPLSLGRLGRPKEN